MWWEWLAIGILLAAATLYLARVARGSLRKLRGGGGCGTGGCCGPTVDRTRTGPLVRELVQLNRETTTEEKITAN